VIALCDDADVAAAGAQAMATAARHSGLDGRTVVVRPTAAGAAVLSPQAAR
jgi:hypothetical protein